MTWIRSWRKWLKWLGEERCFGFQRLCNEPSKIEWLKTIIIYLPTILQLGQCLAEKACLCSTWYLLAGPSMIAFVSTWHVSWCWPGVILFPSGLSMWLVWASFLHDGFRVLRLFTLWPTSPKCKSRSFQTFLVSGLTHPRMSFPPHFISQSSHRASPAQGEGTASGMNTRRPGSLGPQVKETVTSS